MAGQARIFQINVSNGGVPKLPVHGATVTPLGLKGDYQNDRKNHGGPDKALCLYSLECILDLQVEGHPIFSGATGENLTLSGLEWGTLAPGVCLTLGDEVKLEITSYASPCPKIADSFVEGQIERMSQQAHPGWARLYARVVTPGEIRIGDKVDRR
jgi:MOSC domain-containing protein YiiM